MDQLKLRNAPLYVAALAPGNLKLRAAPVYVAIQSPPNLDVRNVRAYALAVPDVDITVRKLSAYALVQPSPVTYLALRGDVALLQAVNKEHGKTLTDAQVFFENARVLANDGRYNSQVTMKPKEGFLYSGSMTFRYNRFPIDDFFASQDTSTLPGNQTTIHARLAAINAAFGCNLIAADVVDGPVAADATSLTLTVASGSFLFAPGSQSTIGTAPSAPDLATMAPVTDLGGFDPENDLVTNAPVTNLAGFDPEG